MKESKPVRNESSPSLPPGCVAACRGCAHRLLAPADSHARKTDWLRDRLAPWADRLAPLRSVDAPERLGYRDRVCLTTAWADGAWRFGLRARRELIPIPDCPVHSERVHAAVRILADALPPGPGFPMVYFVQAGAQATLVLKTGALPPLDWLCDSVRARLVQAGLEGLWLHLHPSAGDRVLAKREWRLVWGRPRSTGEDGMLHGPAAFQQLLPRLASRTLDEAEAFLAPAPGDAVADLYCGGGASLVRWLRREAAAAGVEIGGDAVACAAINAPGALVLRGTCTHRLPQLRTWAAGRDGTRLLYANPPRTGLEPDVLAWAATDFRPARIAYLSCSAGTLRRDLDALHRAGYAVERIAPYDFFPLTHHVEALALLRRDRSLSPVRASPSTPMPPPGIAPVGARIYHLRGTPLTVSPGNEVAMRIPKTIQLVGVTDVGNVTLNVNLGSNWYVWGGHFSEGDKITIRKPGKSDVTNLHISAPLHGSWPHEMTNSIAVKVFHVTFEFDQMMGKRRIRYDFPERSGPATLQNQNLPLTELGAPVPLHEGVSIVDGVVRKKVDPGPGVGGGQIGQSMKWEIAELRQIATNVANAVYAQCYY